MTDFWEQQIARADWLAAQPSGSSELLNFYGELLRAQRQIYQDLTGDREWLPAGDWQSDLPKIRKASPGLLGSVFRHGPAPLASEAQALLNADGDVLDETLSDHWRNPSDVQFFAKAILQPYAYALIERGITARGSELAGGERDCPHCGGRPQLSFLQSKESSESGNRDLFCATCLHSWEYRRVVCANCGEERPSKLGYFHSPEFDHIRIEACDSCRHYLKGIDLTRDGHAAPLVDEIYGAPLDLWAREHGYTKIELNLVGL